MFPGKVYWTEMPVTVTRGGISFSGPRETPLPGFSKHPVGSRTTKKVLTMILKSPPNDAFGIIDIEFDHALVIDFASATDLPGPGKARHHLKALCVCLGIQGQKLVAVAKLKGTWANQAHFTAEHIDQLG